MMFFLYLISSLPSFRFFFFNDTATTEIYTLSLHDALPISRRPDRSPHDLQRAGHRRQVGEIARSEEHTSELQSLAYLVCRLLLEKKKNKLLTIQTTTIPQFASTPISPSARALHYSGSLSYD